MREQGRSFLKLLGLIALSLAVLLAAPAGAEADKAKCKKAITKVSGSFAKKRLKQIGRCDGSARCDKATLDGKLTRLRNKSERKLASSCAGVDSDTMGLGAACPDPSGRCDQNLTSDVAIVDCVLCMVAETVDPMLRRIHGQDSEQHESCGGCSATPCEGEFFCDPSPGHCEEDTEVGVCIEVPEVCTDEFDPVCGCDGETYANDCDRRAERVGFRHPGPCVNFCGGDSGNECPEGTVCIGLEGHCDAVANEGICIPVPDDCGDWEEPVCGCDGETYGNECALMANGMRLDHWGPCIEGCGGDGPDCDEGSFCEAPPGHCDAGAAGHCQPAPDFCPEYYEPVCGCDGETYGNDCYRRSAEVALDHWGPCDDLGSCAAGEGCPGGSFCETPPGHCDAAEASCEPLPPACVELYGPMFLIPVCGCDGQTYENDCLRRAAAVSLEHDGPCREECELGGEGCGEGQFCSLPPGHCGLEGGPGECVPLPEVCPMVFWPVCGCDGQTYINPCAMAAEGVALDHEGHCEEDLPECDPWDPDCEHEWECPPWHLGECPDPADGP